jgi:hypothetical protein
MLKCRKGEYTHIPSGIWIVESGMITKVGINNLDQYVQINICVPGDYLMPDAGTKIYALIDTVISSVSISDIDTVKLMHQINDLEMLSVIRGCALNPPTPGEGIYQGRVAKFLQWLSVKTSLEEKDLFSMFTQHMIGSFVGVKRCAVSTRLAAMGYSLSIKKNK